MKPVAIVTGGAAGVGHEIAAALSRTGHRVLVADTAPAPGDAIRADVRDPADCERIVAAARSFGGPHVLVNNAGGWTPGPQYPDAAPADWSATIALNLTAPMLLSQLVLEPMRDLGGGAIVNISSSGGVGSTAYGSPEYGAAKAGLIRFTTSSAALAQTHDVRMTCVVPDWIGLDRAQAEWRQRGPGTPPLIPPSTVVATVLDLIADGRAGRVVELVPTV
ncbi:3-oxoacyl-ACP reductase [Actinoplanes sp. OR16]|uniref:SDR family NAD(P)-dependent oxidoreductase n=1 Tax=Actinoplanes sp. OR16 TaxID=946334 RepID=UPI000F6C2177|nr:SDR family oxidoreductase [Actinoplanes sp. OR16]BBH69502.1 3-oxoacyl-ACP reductase [Actinoplanes sp. OR16]